MNGAQPLSPLDALFVHLESPRTPLHLGSVAVFDGVPLTRPDGVLRLEELRRVLAGRLELVPKLRQVVRPGWIGQAPPVWQDDPHFDITYHVRAVALPAPGTEEQLAELAADLFAVPLDMNRPLWELWFVEGLAGGRVALVEKVHHALADGLGGVEVATVLLDTAPHSGGPAWPSTVDPGPPPWRPQPPAGWSGVLVRDAGRLAALPLHAVRSVASGTRHPVRAATRLAEIAGAFATVATPRLLAPRTSLNVPIGRGRRLAFVRQPIPPLRSLQARTGVTLNDILLTAAAGGVRRLMVSRGERVEGRAVQVLVPVGLPHHDRTLGNRVSAMLVRLPIGVADPRRRLRLVAAEVADRKRRHQAVAVDVLLRLAAPLPQAAIKLVATAVHHQPVVNLVVTNVPGPPVPLYALGARLVEAFPVVPLAGNLSVGVAALSYDDVLDVGILADRDHCPDVAVLASGIEDEFRSLAAAPGSRRARSGAGHEQSGAGPQRSGAGSRRSVGRSPRAGADDAPVVTTVHGAGGGT